MGGGKPLVVNGWTVFAQATLALQDLKIGKPDVGAADGQNHLVCVTE